MTTLDRKSFNSLPIEHRGLIVVKKATLIHISSEDFYYMHLYHLNGEFIEAVYNCNTRQINDIAMLSFEELDLHLQNINLSQLI